MARLSCWRMAHGASFSHFEPEAAPSSFRHESLWLVPFRKFTATFILTVGCALVTVVILYGH